MTRLAIAAACAAMLCGATFSVAHAQDAQATPVPSGAEEDLQPFIGDEPPEFDTVEELAELFRAGLAANDAAAVADLVGLSADAVAKSPDVMESFAEIRAVAAEAVAIDEIAPDRRMLLLGGKLWAFPFPVTQVDGKWAFDTVAGLEEVINRRIGENELTTIANLRGYVDAQEEYHATDWDLDGVTEYAQNLISTPGNYDGLYWEPGDGVPDSPVGDLIDQAELATAAQDGYFGYRYRVLTGQGDNVAGGAYDYVINGNMLGGFAAIATPVHYDRTGIMTFLVSKNGTVYQKDLGDDTETEAAAITRFDPDDGWTVVADPGD